MPMTAQQWSRVMHMSDEKLQAYPYAGCQLPESIHPVWLVFAVKVVCGDKFRVKKHSQAM
jgi:hypothetical protein